MNKFAENIASWVGTGVGMGIAMPMFIWSFNAWIKIMVQGGWIDLSWLREALK